jgi:hypothetical protein
MGDKMKNTVLGLLALTICVGPAAGSAATLLVDDAGILAGANDVNIRGTLYDVRFATGTCIDLFSGCDEREDFLFTNDFDAFDAAIALMDQVLLGIFDTQPRLTNGCTSVESCGILTPNGAFGTVVSVVMLVNDAGTFDQFFTFGTLATRDQSLFNLTFAIWSLAAAVPEPGTFALFGLGLLGLGLSSARPANR